jgi:hypothetical protein
MQLVMRGPREWRRCEKRQQSCRTPQYSRDGVHGDNLTGALGRTVPR